MGRSVVILGAGMAGLAAGFELSSLGYEPLILEARNRVGGRVFTFRSFAPGLYAEAGAMRIGGSHSRTLEYCNRFELPLRPFIWHDENAPVYLAGQRMTQAQFEHESGRVPFELTDNERRLGYRELWSRATREVRELGKREGINAAMKILAKKYDGYSLLEFLRESGFSEGAIELHGIMTNDPGEANINSSVIETFGMLLALEDMQVIEGGMDRLPNAFYSRLQRHIRLGTQVIAVEQDTDKVTVRYKTPLGVTSATGDYCISTLPFGLLWHVDFTPALSIAKYRAIRGLNYNNATRIVVQVRRKFWEDEGINAGIGATDLPIRRIVYPSTQFAGGDRGMLVVSDTRGQDAARWGALSYGDQIELALRDLEKIHPQIRSEYEDGASHSWYHDPYSAGGFVSFQPYQESTFHADILKPEGRVYFAGEACSLLHGWIEGAVESGIAATDAIQERASAE